MTLLHVANPNSTAAMTAQIERAARAVAAPGTVIRATTAKGTPVSIEGHADEALAVPAMLDQIRAADAEGAAAHIIACFDDCGLWAAREVAAAPVLGICEAAVRVASMLAKRFSIVTTLPRSVPIIEDLVDLYGAARQCPKVRAVALPVLALDADPKTAREKLLAEARRAVDGDGAEAIVLGCAGMAEMAEWLSGELNAPVIDGVAAAVKLGEALAGLGARTSKIGALDYPRDKVLAEAR